MSFVRDLKAGQEAEDSFIDLLQSYGIKCGRNSGTHHKELALYDVWDENYKTYEVKRDLRVAETGNVFLEHKAISHSNAHFVVYKLDTDDDFYILDLPSVKNIIDDNSFVVKNGGNNPVYPGTLVPVAEFRQLFHRVTPTLFKKTSKKVASKKVR